MEMKTPRSATIKALAAILLMAPIAAALVSCPDSGGNDDLSPSPSADSSATPSPTPTPDPTPTPSPGQVAMANDANVIYLHHSTGGNIWGGGVSDALTDYNGGNGKSYQITERAFPSGAPYPWENYPYDYWNIWVNHAGAAEYLDEPTLEILTQTYDVIVFKHCYPVSDIEEDSGSADVGSPSKRLQNYYLQYNALKAKMHTFPNTRFIVWTGAARAQAVVDANPEAGARSRTFFAWVKDTWDESGDNIYVWDFFELETEGGNFLLPEYAADTEGHPNEAFSATVAPYFVNRLVDVIEGRGDVTNLRGEP
jgi:hypothetical protein